MTISLIEETSVKPHLLPLQPFGLLASYAGQGVSLQQVPTIWLEDLVTQHGVVVIRGLARTVSPQELEAYCRRMGDLLRWPFGYVLDLKVTEGTRNYLFTRDDVQFHWDGVFAEAEPRYLFFQCLQAPVDGGESLYSDTTRAWKRASPAEQAWMCSCVCRYHQELTAHYGGDVTTALIREHPITGEITIRYAEPVTGIGGNAPELLNATRTAIDEEGTQRLADFMARVLYAPQVCLEHKWKAGDFLMFDNHRFLHGRRAFGESSNRHLQRVHVL